MIVVGGKNSANTKRLVEICEAIQSNTKHIEIAAEIEANWFKGVESVGITAGASTPSWVIDEVVRRVEEFGVTGSIAPNRAESR
jgi:4-hydroxy-3-methylbut-2-enyl diphosphate reductase